MQLFTCDPCLNDHWIGSALCSKRLRHLPNKWLSNLAGLHDNGQMQQNMWAGPCVSAITHAASISAPYAAPNAATLSLIRDVTRSIRDGHILHTSPRNQTMQIL